MRSAVAYRRSWPVIFLTAGTLLSVSPIPVHSGPVPEPRPPAPLRLRRHRQSASEARAVYGSRGRRGPVRHHQSCVPACGCAADDVPKLEARPKWTERLMRARWNPPSRRDSAIACEIFACVEKSHSGHAGSRDQVQNRSAPNPSSHTAGEFAASLNAHTEMGSAWATSGHGLQYAGHAAAGGASATRRAARGV